MPRVLQRAQERGGEVEARGGRSHGPFVASVNGLIPLVVVGRGAAAEVWGYGDLPKAIEQLGKGFFGCPRKLHDAFAPGVGRDTPRA